MKQTFPLILVLSAMSLALLPGCASRPQLYPNPKLMKVGKDQADRDIEQCENLADDYVSSGKGRAIANGMGRGAAIGGATGAVAGIFSHSIGGGLLSGAAIGATAGGVNAAMSPDQVKRNYVNQCLHDRGYRVIGWN